MTTVNVLKEHLTSRGMNIVLYPIIYDAKEEIITFYLYNLSRQVTGYQQYRPFKSAKQQRNDPKDGRYYTHLKGDQDGMFGLELLKGTRRTIYIVEGVFKAAVLHRLGYNAIAVLTSAPKRLKPWFGIMNETWNLVAIGDNDSAGALLVRTVGKGFQSPKDLDEMSDSDIIELLTLNA